MVKYRKYLHFFRDSSCQASDPELRYEPSAQFKKSDFADDRVLERTQMAKKSKKKAKKS